MPSILNATTTSGLVTSADNSGSLQLQTNNGTTAVTIDTSQNVGIGTSSPSRNVSIFGTNAALTIQNSTTGSTVNDGLVLQQIGNDSYLWNLENSFISFGANNAERMRITSGGNVGIGTTTMTGVLNVSGGGNNTYLTQTTGAGYVLQTDATVNGGVYYFVNFLKSGVGISNITSNGTTISYNTGSDYRLKDNIQPITNALETVAKLKPSKWDWKEFWGGGSSQGFVAHELAEVVPDCVTGEKDAVDAEGKPVYQGVDTSFLVATLTAAIQELKAELDATKAEVQALKGVA